MQPGDEIIVNIETGEVLINGVVRNDYKMEVNNSLYTFYNSSNAIQSNLNLEIHKDPCGNNEVKRLFINEQVQNQRYQSLKDSDSMLDHVDRLLKDKAIKPLN